MNDRTVADPAFPDLVGVVGGPMIPCKVTEIAATMAPTGLIQDEFGAHYEQTKRYEIRYLPKGAARKPVDPSGDLDAAIRAKLAERPTFATHELSGERARDANAWTQHAASALTAVLDRHKPTYYNGTVEYAHREEPVFSADGTPRGTVEVRGEALPPDWCEPCAAVTPCDEVLAIAKALGVESTG